MSDARGLRCPHCRGQRLMVTKTHRPCAGVIVRYRKCSACGGKVKSEERIVVAVKTMSRSGQGSG